MDISFVNNQQQLAQLYNFKLNLIYFTWITYQYTFSKILKLWEKLLSPEPNKSTYFLSFLNQLVGEPFH